MAKRTDADWERMLPEMQWDRIVERLEAVRLASGLTQAAFADAVEITASQYSNWKIGKGGTDNKPSKPSIYHLAAFARHYRVTLDFLCLGDASAIQPYSYRDDIVSRLSVGGRRNALGKRKT